MKIFDRHFLSSFIHAPPMLRVTPTYQPRIPYLLFSFLFLHFVCLPFINAQSNTITHFGIEEGLSDISCNAGILDSKGYLWVCTDYGLNRYDGTGFKKYLPDYHSSSTLKNTQINGILENKDGSFWVLSSMCLYHFDPSTEIFTPTRLNYNDNYDGTKELDDFIKIDNSLWICGKGGLFQYNIEKDTFINYPIRTDLVGARAHHDYNRFEFIKYNPIKESLLVGREEAFSFDLKTKKYIPNSSCILHTMDAHLEDDIIWAVSWRQGIFEYNQTSQTCQQYFWKEKPSVVYKSIIPKNDSILFLCAHHYGLFEFNKNTKLITRIALHESNQNTPDIDQIDALIRDKSENTWLFTWGGVIKLGYDKSYITNYVIPEAFKVKDASHIVLRTTAAINNNEYLLTTDNKESVLKYNIQTNNIERMPIFKKEGGLDFSWHCYETFKDQNDRIWISNGILFTYNRDKNRIESYKEEEFKRQFGHTLIFSMVEDNQSNIYFGSANKGLIKYDIKLDSFIQFFATKPGNIPDKRIRLEEMFITEDNILFQSTDAYGTFRFDLTNQTWLPKIENIYSDKMKPTALFKIYFQFNENKYVAVHEGRLFMINENGLILKEIKDNFGIPFSSVLAACKLKDQSFLILSTNGLYRLNKDMDIFAYQSKQGIKDLSGWSTTLKVLQNGKVFIGKKNSTFNLFDPADLPQNPNAPPIVLTDIQFIGDTVELEKQIDYLDEINLTYRQNFFTFSFAALNFTNPEKNQYKYKLDGLHDDWIDNGNQSKATFTDLKPGQYTFHVNGSNNDGVWNPDGRSIRINISPPWYKSALAYVLYAILFMLAVWYFWNFQKRKWALNAKLKEEENEALRLKELDETKNKIYTNITHEFRTPLTVIQGLSSKIKGNETIKQKINSNSKNLLSLVNQMLALSKMESGYLKIDCVQIDVIPYLNYITDSFGSMANLKHLSLSFYSDQEKLVMDADPEKLKVLVSNLILNAIKYTKQYGKIMVSVQRENEHCILKVKDTGIGISKTEQTKIFDRFYQVDKGSEGGAGIGLAIVKEFCELMGGEVHLESELKKGTSIQIRLPITNEAVMDKNPLLIEEAMPAAFITPSEAKPTDAAKVLLIEDNHDVAYYIMQVLKDQFQCIHKLNGVEGLQQANAEIPDIIISDIMMPDMNGIEMTKKLKANVLTSHIPIILLTAKATDADKIKGIEAGASAYLTKPFNEEELLVRLKSILSNKQHLQHYYNQHQALPADTPKENEFLEKVKQVIELNLADTTFGVQQICQAVHLERTQVYRKLKALTGLSPSEMIKDIRLRKAKEMLLDTDKNVSEVAYACGFKEVSYFSKVFKGKFGVTPSKVN